MHPQFWPEDLDYAGKKVVVIGSGATAITLVPAMATGDAAGHVTMLQRSPTYIMPVPETTLWPRRWRSSGSPTGLIYRIGRARNIALQQAIYKLAAPGPRWRARCCSPPSAPSSARTWT